MDRREFLFKAGQFAALLPGLNRGTAERGVRVSVDTGRVVGPIPVDFTGLGYEISSVARAGLLSAQNLVYVQLVRTLGTRGVIRVGGNTSDYLSNSRAVHEFNLRELGTFLEATGWKLIWGLNLGSGSEQEAVEQARAVLAATGERLLAFEIGNEPDLFGGGVAHRAKGYGYGDYLNDYRRYKAAIRGKIPNAPFAGPDAAVATDWVTRFAGDEGADLKLLTHHYYRECAGPNSTLDKLLHPDPKLAPELSKLAAASQAGHVPYRICEVNSFCGGGKPGVSDTFGSALWVLDYMFTLAYADCAGVNMETGVNQLGFISSYSPIGDDEHGAHWAAPEYYGMLAFAQAGGGQRLALDCEANGVNLSAYAVLGDAQQVSVILINKDELQDAAVRVEMKQGFSDGRVLRLVGPSLASKSGVIFGGSMVTANGEWRPGAG